MSGDRTRTAGGAEPGRVRVRVRQILQQTSGLPNYSESLDLTWLRTRYAEPRELLDLALQRPMRFPPGSRWEYSNTNYVVAGPVKDVTELDPSWMWASGQLVSTPADLQRFFKALMGGAIVPPAQLAEMTRTVPSDLWPGARYGLGLISTSLSCGGEYWGHGGDVLGYETRGGVTRDGRGAELVVTSMPRDRKAHDAVMSFVDHEICEARK